MANKILETTQLSIEVESGTDKDGNPTYKKKNIANVKAGADIDKVSEVVDKVRDVLNDDTRYFYLNEISKVEN